MNKEFKIGLVVTTAIFMLYWGSNYLTGDNIFQEEASIYAKYQNLDGLTSSSGVNYRGAQVGSVKGIEFDTKATDGYCWVVKFDVTREGVVLKDSCIAEIASSDLLGTMVVSLSELDSGSAFVKVGDTLKGVLSKSLQDKVDERLRPLQKKIDQLVSSADVLINTFVTVMDDRTQNNLKRSFEQIPAAMKNILNTTKSLDSITTDLKNAKVQRIVDHIESLTKTLNNNSDKITGIIANLDNLTDSLAKSNIKQTIGRVNQVLTETETIVTKINNGEGTVGMLLNDKKLYEHLVLASADLDFLLLDLKQNPGRYLNISLLNFGSKRQKEPIALDSSHYDVLKQNAELLDKFNNKLAEKLMKEISDSCGYPCDSIKMQQILKKHSKEVE